MYIPAEGKVKSGSTGKLGYDRPLYDRLLSMTDGMLGPSAMHSIESVISKFACIRSNKVDIGRSIVSLSNTVEHEIHAGPKYSEFGSSAS